LNNLTSKQQLKIKGPVVDMDNRFNEVFPSFDLFNKEFALDHCLIDVFSNCFSFHTPNKQSVKIVDGELYFIFSFHFHFTLLFFFFFTFLFLEQLGLGFISHAVTSVTN